jgi:hypothetical protein
MPFKPGQSGNPGGRPPVLAEARKLAQSYTEENINGLMALARDTEQPGQVRVSAYNAVLDRALGKPVQPNEHSGPGGGPIPFEDPRLPLAQMVATARAKRGEAKA